MGVLQIGIRAWLQHLACLGSWMSRLKTMFKELLRVTPYLTSFLKSPIKLLLKKIMKTFYHVCVYMKAGLVKITGLDLLKESS